MPTQVCKKVVKSTEPFWASQELNDLQALASMRHVLAHGNLWPRKAPAVLVHLTQQLQLSITPT